MAARKDPQNDGQLCLTSSGNESEAPQCFPTTPFIALATVEVLGETGVIQVFDGANRLVFSAPNAAPAVAAETALLSQSHNAVGGLRVVSSQQQTEVMAYLQNFNRSVGINVVWLMLTVAPFALLVAYLLARRLIRPLEELAEAANQISLGKIDTEIAYARGRNDEVGVLARSINRMAVSLKIALSRLTPA